MEVDTRFPTKLNSVSDAPEPLRSALLENLPPGKPARLLVHAPAFQTGDEALPATVLAVTDTGWLLLSETGNRGVTLEQSGFDDTLYLELESILLTNQLTITFAGTNAPRSVTVKFESVGDDLYCEAIDLILGGIDPALTAAAGAGKKDSHQASMLEAWPMKLRNEAQRFWPGGQRLLAALQWPAVSDESQRRLAPAGALLVTLRELVVIADEQILSVEPPSAEEVKEDFGGIITFVPRVRLASFQIRRQAEFAVLALQVNAAHGGDELEVTFPSREETAVSDAIEQMLVSRNPAE